MLEVFMSQTLDGSWEGTLAGLAARANRADLDVVWPAESWEGVKRSEALRWCIPAQYGGQERTGADLLKGYESLATACLTTCFILSQREGACRRIRDIGKPSLCEELLPRLARGELFATVGLSHLTTSRQHGKPALAARTTEKHYILTGTMPWVTGASMANLLVTGAVLDDGQQILLVVPRKSEGLRVGPPLPLMALAGSLTAEVFCENVAVEKKWLLAGPAPKVMTAGRAGTGGLETSCLALGLARAAVDHVQQEAKTREELRASAERLEATLQKLRHELHDLADGGGTPEAALSLRAHANKFVLKATQAALTASKGTGFLKDHPAQRWARQALFFLVWSCPRPAAEATLAYLTTDEEFTCP
jgi:alkylation response protein AidB-like acyl-CoA dehydrogenase